MEKILRLINCILLAAILLVLISIMKKMPPNINDLLKAREDKISMEILRNKVPLVKTFGTVDVDVNNEVDVNVTNTPLEVTQY